jgi:WD40 repeat protein
VTSHRNIAPSFIQLLLTFAFVLSACQETTPIQELPSVIPLQDKASETPARGFTSATRPTPTLTLSMEPTPSSTWTQTPSPTPPPPNLSLTPLPEIISPITWDTLDQVEHLAVWGSGAPDHIALSEDGSLLAVGTALGTYIYDSYDFLFVTLLQSDQPVSAVAFSPDNHWISVAEGSNRVVIYNQDSFNAFKLLDLSSYPLPADSSPALFFSPDGDKLTLLVELNDEIIVLRWETTTWQISTPFSINTGLESFVNPSIGVLGVITEENLILHSLALPSDFRKLPLPPNQGEVQQAEQTGIKSPIIPASNGDFLLLNQGDTVAYWDIINNEIVYHLEGYPQREGDPCEDLPDTCRNSEGGFSFSCSDVLAQPDQPIRLLAITPDDQRMLISLDANRIELRSTRSGEGIWEADAGYTNVLFSLNGRALFGRRPDGAFEKRDLLNGKLLRTMKQHPSQLFDLAFSPDGRLLAAGFNDAWVRVFSTQSGEMLGVLEGPAQSLRFSPDGQQLAAGLTNGIIRIFQLNQGRSFDLGSGHQGPITGIVFSPDGSQLITASQDCTIRQWDIKDRYRTDTLIPLEANPIQILGLEKLEESEMLFAAGAQTILAITGETVDPLFTQDQGNFIVDIAVTRDGRYLAAGGSSLWLFMMEQAGWQSVPIQGSLPIEGKPVRVVFLPEGNCLLAVDDQTLSFFSINQNHEASLRRQLELPPSMDSPASLVVSPQGDLIAIGSENGLVHIYGIPKITN